MEKTDDEIALEMEYDRGYQNGSRDTTKEMLKKRDEYAEEYAKAFLTWFHTTQRNHDPGYAQRNAIDYMNQFKEFLKK
jgi:hypothetical protein